MAEALIERLRNDVCLTSQLDWQEHVALAREAADKLTRFTAQRDELRALLWFAWHEFNAIRARDGAPQHIDWYRGQPLQTDGCTKEWWSELTDALGAELGEDTKPWPIKPWNEIRAAIDNTEAS